MPVPAVRRRPQRWVAPDGATVGGTATRNVYKHSRINYRCDDGRDRGCGCSIGHRKRRVHYCRGSL